MVLVGDILSISVLHADKISPGVIIITRYAGTRGIIQRCYISTPVCHIINVLECSSTTQLILDSSGTPFRIIEGVFLL